MSTVADFLAQGVPYYMPHASETADGMSDTDTSPKLTQLVNEGLFVRNTLATEN